MSYAVLFPGQGSQFVGMGRELFEAREDLLGATADEVLGWSLSSVCLEGPPEELTRTDRAQPALYALSYALWVELSSAGIPIPAGAAGHSLGEYTAHAAAGTFDYLTGLRLVAARGRAMARAAEAAPSGMAALLGTEPAVAEAAAADRRAAGGQLWVANLNGGGQVVVAGGTADLEWLAGDAQEYGIRRVVPLDVAGGFHSPFMEPAADALAEALDLVSFGEPRFPIWANASAHPVPRAEIKGSLATQVTSPVRFGETLTGMAEVGVSRFVHIGPGDVTAGMAKRTVRGTEVAVVNSLEGIEPAVATLS